jgi:hypothetical protein
MKCPYCQNELRKEDFVLMRLHPANTGALIVGCVLCDSEISVRAVIAYEPIDVYRRAEDKTQQPKLGAKL